MGELFTSAWQLKGAPLVLLGQVLELRARERTSGAIRALLNLAPRTARRIRADGSDEEIGDPMRPINVGFYVSAGVSVIGFGLINHFYLIDPATGKICSAKRHDLWGDLFKFRARMISPTAAEIT